MNEADLGLAALAVLGLAGVGCGLVTLRVLRAYCDQASIARAKSLIAAHMLEFRLFGDEPARVLHAQRDVAVQTLRLARLLLVPVVIMSVPMWVLLVQLDAFFGKSPLVPGQPSVVTMQWQGTGEAPQLEPGAGIAVETVPIHASALNEVSWRIRPTHSGTNLLRFVSGGKILTKSVTVGRGMGYVSDRRVRFGADLLLHMTEWPLPDLGVQWIEIPYDGAVVCGLHWLIWFLLFSGAAFFIGSR